MSQFLSQAAIEASDLARSGQSQARNAAGHCRVEAFVVEQRDERISADAGLGIVFVGEEFLGRQC
jgi:hypothetical protein